MEGMLRHPLFFVAIRSESARQVRAATRLVWAKVSGAQLIVVVTVEVAAL